MKPTAKSINLLLYDGTLNGVISIEDSNWNAGELYSAPRESVTDLLKTDACSKYGVYLLLSTDMVYVGQSSDLSKRVTQHIIGKEWWERVLILTTKDDSLTHSDIDYLENVLIDKATTIKKLDCENKKKGNPPKVDKFRRVYLGQYLEEALFLMQLIGINVFTETPSSDNTNTVAAKARPVIDTMNTKDKLSLGMRVKSEAIDYIRKQGVSLSDTITYASYNSSGKHFWMNPYTSCLSENWNIVLNDTENSELIIFLISSSTLSLASGNNKGLVVRKDMPNRIDLKLSPESFIDKRSGTDFSPFIVTRIKY